MRRRTPGTVTFAANRTQDWAPSSERRAEESKARPFRTLPTQLVTHPLFGVVLFLIFFPGNLRRSLLSLTGEQTGAVAATSLHQGPEFCAQAVKPPYNTTGTAFQKYWADLQQRRSGEPDAFQSAYEDARAPITKNYTELAAALQNGDSLTSAQQNLLHSAVDITHKQLERFACCAPLQPPFLISATGHWTQDSRLTTEYLKQLISTYVYDQQAQKPFWQRMLGLRRLLSTTTPTPPIAEGEDMGKGRIWASRPRADQAADPGEPHSSSQALISSINLGSVLAGAKALSQRQGSKGSGTEGRAVGDRPDPHQPFNATTAYANVTRCNTKRWLSVHAGGTNFSQPRRSASGKTVQPASMVSLSPAENEDYKAIPVTTFQGKAADSEGSAQVLVVYHYYESLTTCEEDEEVQVIRSNLLSFLRFAVRENDGADYVISMGGRMNPSLLDLIPAFCNVRLRFVDNSTMHSDTCSFQKALVEFGPALLQRYKYFVVINNGMRGPFARANQGMELHHWTQPFIDQLNSHVKLVGPYLSCEIKVHVQGPFLVMDRVGVQYLLDIWGGCWSDHQTDIENGEVGLSQAILADGYNIASMQHEYLGLDFRQQPDRLQCKGRLAGANPTFCCDTPDPFQLHWVKYGGAVYRLGLIPPMLIRMVEDLTARTMELTPPLIPNGSHWRLPHPSWVQQQQQASEEDVQSASWWRRIFLALARFLGLVDDSLQGSEEPHADPDWTVERRVSALLESVPLHTQQAANEFYCSHRSLESGKTTQARDQLAFELDEVKTETSGGDQAKIYFKLKKSQDTRLLPFMPQPNTMYTAHVHQRAPQLHPESGRSCC
ncbi:hypothetical protein WJX82_002656 [Trebouxia sp. C0006]